MLDQVGIDPVRQRRPGGPANSPAASASASASPAPSCCKPKLLVCDEIVSALDVSVQAQILNLMQDLKRQYDLTVLFIAHDLAVVKNVSDRVAVMYLGRLCEIAPSDLLYETPAHHYTAALLASAVEPDPEAPRTTAALTGEPPSPINPPSGCRFRTRCPRAEARCAEEVPEMREIGPEPPGGLPLPHRQLSSAVRAGPAHGGVAAGPSEGDRTWPPRPAPSSRISSTTGPSCAAPWPAPAWTPTTAVWNDPGVDWTAFDLVLANGAWDNIHHVDAFLAWVDGVAASGVPVRNSPATLRWNIDKHYLQDLERAGVPTVPTIWVEPGACRQRGRGPRSARGRVGGEAVRVRWRLPDGALRAARARRRPGRTSPDLVAAGRTAMVQPYEPRVDTEGETALVFVGGRFTHALHKEPMIQRGVGPLDNLIDNQVVTAATATAAQLDLAGRALAAAEELVGPTSYARVDMVDTLDRGPALLELELLDPVLFFAQHPQGAAAAEAMAMELARQLSDS